MANVTINISTDDNKQIMQPTPNIQQPTFYQKQSTKKYFYDKWGWLIVSCVWTLLLGVFSYLFTTALEPTFLSVATSHSQAVQHFANQTNAWALNHKTDMVIFAYCLIVMAFIEIALWMSYFDHCKKWVVINGNITTKHSWGFALIVFINTIAAILLLITPIWMLVIGHNTFDPNAVHNMLQTLAKEHLPADIFKDLVVAALVALVCVVILTPIVFANVQKTHRSAY